MFLQFNLSDVSKEFSYFVIAMIIFIGIIFRVPPSDMRRNIDEIIPIDTIGAMHTRGDLNTDWNMSSHDVRHKFGKARYNFASYLTISSFLIPITNNQDVRLAHLRSINIIFYILSMIMLLTCTIELKFSNLARLIATLLFTFSPGLVHDSMMARPESFMTTFTLIYIWASISTQKNWRIYTMVAGIALGILIATKFSMSSISTLYFLILAITSKDNSIKNIVYFIWLFCIFTLIGFIMFAPYAVFDYPGFIDGLQKLRLQYYGLHGPHSHINGGNTFFWQIEFYTKLYGVMFIAPLIVVILYSKNKMALSNVIVISISISAIIFFFILATASVFFERNLHPILPLFILATSFLFDELNKSSFSRLSVAIFAILLLIPVIYWSVKIKEVQQVEYVNKYNKFRNNLKLKFNASEKTVANASQKNRLESCGLVRLIDYSDERSKIVLKQYYSKHWKLVGIHLSPFQYIPTSTMHIYLVANSYWFYKKCW